MWLSSNLHTSLYSRYLQLVVQVIEEAGVHFSRYFLKFVIDIKSHFICASHMHRFHFVFSTCMRPHFRLPTDVCFSFSISSRHCIPFPKFTFQIMMFTNMLAKYVGDNVMPFLQND
jgi:hypothetical protein